jgi:glycosyltransferase involved in cell wall biosynthesis
VTGPDRKAGRTGGPTVSVVIPAYRASSTLGRALASVRNQTLMPLEILVVDDGSEADLATGLGPEFGAIDLLRRENGGPAAARNDGLGRVRGDLVGFLDADDFWNPRGLEQLRAPFLAPDPPDVVQGRLLDVWPPEAGLPTPGVPRRSFNVGAALFRRSALLRIGGFDPALRSGEDIDLWVRLRADGAEVCTVEAVVLNYVRRPLEKGFSPSDFHAARLGSLKRLLDRERARRRR